MPRKQNIVRLTPDDRRALTRLVRTGRQSAWTLQRARILLLADVAIKDPGRRRGRHRRGRDFPHGRRGAVRLVRRGSPA